MPIPMQSTTGDATFRAQNNSVSAIKRFSRASADAALKLNNRERLISAGDDPLSFNVSRRIRSEVASLKVVNETGQLNITGLSLAIDALETIKVQLDKLKMKVVQAQVADDSERDSIQSEIDLALAQIDSTANNTKLGSRSLLNGDATINAFRSITNAGLERDWGIRASGMSLMASAGIQNVRVNKIGNGGPVRRISTGQTVLSLNVSIKSLNKATRVFMSYIPGAAAADFAEFRITGKLGSATIRVNSSTISTLGGAAGIGGVATSFNMLAQETGVVFTSSTGGPVGLTTVGYGSDEFIKVELLSEGGTTIGFGNAAGAVTASDTVGTVLSQYGTGGFATINGTRVELGGEYGLTARYLSGGYDIEIDFGTLNMETATAPVAITDRVNVDLGQGVVGLLGTDGRQGDMLKYGFGKFTTENLGRGLALNTMTMYSVGSAIYTASVFSNGNQILGRGSLADVGSGGSLSLKTGNFVGTFAMINRSIDQLIKEQTRLGTIQGNFIDAINRAEVSIGNLTSADADIVGVDAATEITNMVQAQLGISTASSVLAQANAIQANIFSLLRG